MGRMSDVPSETRSQGGPSVNGCFLDRLLLIAGARADAPARRRDAIARRHGVTGDHNPLATVLAVAEALGLAPEHRRLAWAELADARHRLPALLIFRDGATAILDRLDPGDAAGPLALHLRNEGESPDPPTLALNRRDMALFWDGDIILPAPRTVERGRAMTA